MASVHTAYGPGEVVETKTVRGRTEYRVAGNGFDVWLDGTKLGFAEVDHDNSVNLPYDPTPQYGVGALTDSTIQPIHEIDPDERLSPSDSQSFDDRSESEAGNQPGPNPDLFAKSSAYYAAIGDPTPHQTGPYGLDRNAPELQEYAHPSLQHDDDYDYSTEGGPGAEPMTQDAQPFYHPSDAYGDLDQPYPEDTGFDGGRMQQIHQQAPHSFGNSVDQMDHYNHLGYRQADVLEGAPTRFEPNFIVNDTDDEFLHDEDVEADERETTGPDDIVHFASNQRTAWAALPALLESVGPQVARGVAGHEIGQALGGGGDEDAQQNQGTPPSGVDAAGNAMDQVAPDGHPLPIPDLEGTGWGSLTQKKGYTEHEAVDWQGLMQHPIEQEGGYEALPAHEWLERHREPQEGDSDYAYASLRPAGLDARYADIYAAYDPNDKVAQFRHDPEAFINRVGHAEYEGLDPRFGSYVDMVDADEMLRTAAWKDVREKAVRLRKEGRVHVKDVGDDRIYASVQGDHGTYDVMIKKGGAFGGFGGGHAITNWHCACEWGKWAFQRRFTFVGRLCSHGYACYQEMQSNHLKGKPQRRKTQPRRAERIASDQTESDWTVDGNVPTTELNKLRSWAEQPHDTWNGNQAEHNEDVRDAVEKAREEGVDTDQLVASLIRHATPEDDKLPGPGGDTQIPGPANVPAGSFGPGGNTELKVPSTGFGPGGNTRINIPDQIADSPLGRMFGLGDEPGGQLPAPGVGQPQAGGLPGADMNARNEEKRSGTPEGGTGAAGIAQQPDKGGAGTSPAGGGNNSYTVKPGDTLSGIAQSHGGGDYNSITNQGGGAISNKDLITPGQKVDLSSMGGQGATKGWGQGDSGAGAPSAGWGMNGGGAGAKADTSAVSGAGASAGAGNSLGTSTSAPSKGWGMGSSATQKPASRRQAAPNSNITPGDPNADADPSGGADPISPSMGNPSNGAISNPSQSNAIDGSPSANSTPAAPGAAGGIAAGGSGGAQGLGQTPGGLGDFSKGLSDFSNTLSPIMDTVGQVGGMVGDVVGGIGGALGGILGSHQLEADRDWFEAAYPDAKFHDHKPFNGTGGENITEWGQSKDNVKDNYADNFTDVTDEPKKTFLEDNGSVEDIRKNGARGIARAGHGPQRPAVQPQVVRERKPRNPAHVEAHVPDFVDFDPLAPRTAASFDDPYAEQAAEQAGILAAANGGDIVRQFQAGGGGAINTPVQSAYDDFSDSPVIRQAMQRTAGRNYSLAEQAALVREGDRGGAGNLDSLQLEGTHYEAMNSVGLW